ncbi:MAG: hypothetical protein EA397_17055 [Deltaproteobacteria bacterium]|nr:MAG: hypothetical protein EA397_17055 [Deltaproteobacteria bacterium]
MTDPLTLGVAVVALGLALLIAWLARPRPPELQGERWFKAWLATLLRGRIEAQRDSGETWASLVDRAVLFHPLARRPEDKLDAPPRVERPAREGEEALVQALAALPDRAARWAHLYERDEVGRAARLGDPHDLGRAHLPSSWLGPSITWDVVADAASDPGPLIEALRRASSARWVLVPGRERGGPSLLPALAALLGDRAIRYEPSAPSELALQAFRGPISERRPGAPSHVEASVALLEKLHATASKPSDRLVLIGEGEGIHPILDALLASDALRDQVDAVVAVASPIAGADDLDHPCDPAGAARFLQRWFTHDDLDLEASHRCPYFSVQWLTPEHEPPGAFGVALARARFPTPKDAPRLSIEPVDLGPLRPVDDLPLDLVSMALWGVVSCWVRARRV